MGGDQNNPKGYFEDGEITQINEALLTPISQALGIEVPYGVHWMIPLDKVSFSPGAMWRYRMQHLMTHRPFCFKDPRFTYTLPAWRPHLPEDVVFVCVFRHPSITASSMRNFDHKGYYKPSFKVAADTWLCMYRHIYDVHRHQGQWLFLHYDQVLTPGGLDRLEAALGCTVDRTFPELALKRSKPAWPGAPGSLALYQRLCELADYSPADL